MTKLQKERIDAGLCAYCGKPRDGKSKWYCTVCSKAKYQYQRQRLVKIDAMGICRTCGKPKDNTRYVNCLSCVTKNRAMTMQWRTGLKREVYEAYGGFVCACCGETNPGFLTLDHINNDGNIHRRTLGRGDVRVGSVMMFKALKDAGFPPGFQVLCYNCNMGKARNGGVCPHKENRDA